MKQYYNVADHVFSIEAPEQVLALLTNYAPFKINPVEDPLFAIEVHEAPVPSTEDWNLLYTDRSDEDMPRIEMYQRPDEWLFCVSMYRESETVCAMRCSANWKHIDLFMQAQTARFAIDNAAMLVYAFATAAKATLLFHSSVTVLDGKAYMFLGHSGTGKSTHSQQWHAAFPEAHLLNDDNPAVRVWDDQRVVVYGTPWSGKTPCYRNESAPVQALVQLAQAPENTITRLKMTQAYPYILASVSGLKVMPEMMDRIFESIAKVLEISPVYRLECLPNPDAARLCAQTCSLSNGRTDSSL
jgi:hypothetical protein